MRRLYMMRGPSGALKTTLVDKKFPPKAGDEDAVAVFSADDFFVGEDAIYRFDPRLLDEAHRTCFRDYAEWVIGNEGGVAIVDNTHATAWEMASYIQMALSWGMFVEIIQLNCDPVVATRRGIHGVPLSTNARIVETIANEVLPRHWKKFLTTLDTTEGLKL